MNLFSLHINPIIYLLPLPIFYLYILKKKKPDYYSLILEADKHFNLEERLITFWEYRDYEDSYGLMRKLKKDLEDRLSSIDLTKSYKFRPSNILKLLSLLFLFLLILNLIYSFPKDISKIVELVEDKRQENLRQTSKLLSQEKNKLIDEELLNKNIPKEALSQDEYDKEKIKDLEKPKSLEEFLSQYNFSKNDLKKEMSETNSDLTQKEKEAKSEKSKESQQRGSETAINNNLTGGAGVNQPFSSQSKRGNLQEERGENELRKDIEGSPSQSISEKMVQSPVLGDSDYSAKDRTKSGSLPGTEERETKLGDKETERKVFSGEKVYVPPTISEEEGKNYLFQAPTLEGRRKLKGENLNFSPIYEREKPVASRILPLEFQEILKIYFSQ